MTATAPEQAHTGLERFPARGPRGTWPAEEHATVQCARGIHTQVVMDLSADQFLVVTDTTTQ
ncbi:hypothetical protein [Streptomyces sp. NPDC058667]|uniref:hypothetical protein n=1 Tax=Streptomyces sp. NPDC058667 TaxID=3346588 RepID=UPI00365873A4